MSRNLGPYPKHRDKVPRVVELYRKLGRVQGVVAALAKEGVDVSDTWVCGRLKEQGIETQGYRRRGRRELAYNGRTLVLMGRHSTDKVCAILDDYQDGKPPMQLSEEYDAPVSSIEKWVARAGICRDSAEAAANRRVNEGFISPIAAARIAERLYVEEKMSLTQGADEMGVCTATFLDYLRKRGVKTRTQSEGELVRIHGSLSEWRRYVLSICKMFHVDGMNRTEITEEVGCCYRTVNAALDSDINHYRIDEDAYETDEIEKAMLEWAPADSYSARNGDGLRVHRTLNSRSAAA